MARRRRVARVSSLALVAGLALGGGGWAVAEHPWASSSVLPGEPSVAPTSEGADAQLKPIPAEGFSQAPYWHVVTENRVPAAVGGPLEIERNEYWFGNDRQGMRFSRHDDGSSATQPLPEEIVF